MTLSQTIILLLVTGSSLALAAPRITARPDQPPGAIQPVTTGFRAPPPLAQIKLDPAIPGVKKIEYASNGFIEVAHALILETPTQTGASADLVTAQLAVSRILESRSSLEEVDVSLYASGSYEGVGGRLPRLTASVPRSKLEAFMAVQPQTASRFDRLWFNPEILTARPASSILSEQSPRFYGPPSSLRGQRLRRLSSEPTGVQRGGLYFNGDPTKPLAALTFDDAPHPLFEPLLLDTLRRGGVKATFFVIGRNATAYPYFVRDMVNAGHEIGNHTMHHLRLPALSSVEVRAELEDCNRILQTITGKPVRYFRAPGGKYTRRTLRIASGLGLVTTFWTDDPGDFDNLGDVALKSKLVRRLHPGGIVLMHDNVLQSIEVLPGFLDAARRQGIALTTMGELDASDGHN